MYFAKLLLKMLISTIQYTPMLFFFNSGCLDNRSLYTVTQQQRVILCIDVSQIVNPAPEVMCIGVSQIVNICTGGL